MNELFSALTLICLLVLIVSCFATNTTVHAGDILQYFHFLLYDYTVISAFILDVLLVAYIGCWMPSGHRISFESIEHLSILEIV